jgi:hypothetical protein
VFRGYIVFVVNGLYRADWLTCTAVDTLVRLNVKHAITFIDAVHGTLFNAGPVLEIYTGKGDDIGHFYSNESGAIAVRRFTKGCYRCSTYRFPSPLAPTVPKMFHPF